jgi:hypothetical protein
MFHRSPSRRPECRPLPGRVARRPARPRLRAPPGGHPRSGPGLAASSFSRSFVPPRQHTRCHGADGLGQPDGQLRADNRGPVAHDPQAQALPQLAGDAGPASLYAENQPFLRLEGDADCPAPACLTPLWTGCWANAPRSWRRSENRRAPARRGRFAGTSALSSTALRTGRCAGRSSADEPRNRMPPSLLEKKVALAGPAVTHFAHGPWGGLPVPADRHLPGSPRPKSAAER